MPGPAGAGLGGIRADTEGGRPGSRGLQTGKVRSPATGPRRRQGGTSPAGGLLRASTSGGRALAHSPLRWRMPTVARLMRLEEFGGGRDSAVPPPPAGPVPERARSATSLHRAAASGGGVLVGGLLGQHLLDRLTAEGRLAEQGEIGHRRQAVEIGPLVHPLAQQLLGGGELGVPLWLVAPPKRPWPRSASARPKSVIRSVPSGSMSMFSGLMSRCTRPAAWAWAERAERLAQQSERPLEGQRAVASRPAGPRWGPAPSPSCTRPGRPGPPMS